MLIAEHVRMSPGQFAADGFDDVCKRKFAGFFGETAVEHHLKQQIAELRPQLRQILALNGIGDFIRFLNRVGSHTSKRLGQIPGAAAIRVSQRGHYFE